MSSTAWYGPRFFRNVFLVGVVALLALGARSFLARDARATDGAPPLDPAPEPALLVARIEPTASAVLASAGRENVPASENTVGNATEPVPAAVPTPVKPPPAFLPPELHVLAQRIPAQLDAFDAATPAERLHRGRELLAFSIAVIQCAHGTGPIPRGMVGDGDLSFAGQEGKWSFQLNMRTFHFDERDFPEYADYLALLDTVYDEQGHLLAKDTELPEQLTQDIRLRAHEALGWL